jgi:hypothetical protein
MQQLDIFADSIPVQRTNDLIASLLGFDRAASRRALHRLRDADANHAGLARFQLLCDFLDHWDERYLDADGTCAPPDIFADEYLLRVQITPAAEVMGIAGSGLVRDCWGILAKASERAGITPSHPDCFAAELYLRAQQFPDAVRLAMQVPGADMRAVVQRWLGLGYFGCGETDRARSAVMRYAWLAPQQFNALVDEAGDAALARDWSNFQAVLDELDASWFPAWCAHENKAASSVLDNLPDGDGCSAYRLVCGLAIRERGGLGSALYEDRARLKQLDEHFFAFYMQRRSSAKNPRKA